MKETNKAEGTVSLYRVLTIGGAFIAFLIGSGFATGQEIIQYFACFGWQGIAGVATIFALFLYVGVSFISAGYEEQFPNGKDIFRYYCGRYLGAFFEWFSVVFIYMSFIVMIAGAGAAGREQFGLPVWAGGVLMGVLAVCTVVLGLNRIVDVIGLIGPAIVVLAIFLGFMGIQMNFEALANVDEVLPSLNLMKVSDNWFMAAFSYVGFCMMWLAAFLASTGKTANSKAEARWGAVLGAFLFSLAVLVMMLGLMANLKDIAGSDIPSLVLANKLSPALGYVFSVVIFAGIYTTAVPLLWTPAVRVAPDERSAKFRLVTLLLGALGVAVGLGISFQRLVNVIYGINGYIGFALLFLMIFKSTQDLK